VATILFTQNLRRHVDVERLSVHGATVAEALQHVFDDYPRMRGYLLDDTGAVRTHVAILLDGESIKDRAKQMDTLSENSEIFVVQALSGG